MQQDMTAATARPEAPETAPAAEVAEVAEAPEAPEANNTAKTKSYPPLSERERRIWQLAADQLEAPWYSCFRRACRRKRLCSSWNTEFACPSCVANMSDEQRRLFGRLCGMTEAFDEQLQTHTVTNRHRKPVDPEEDWLLLAAFEILDRLAPGDPERLAEFRDFWRREVKMRVLSRKNTHSGNGTDISEPAHTSSST